MHAYMQTVMCTEISLYIYIICTYIDRLTQLQNLKHDNSRTCLKLRAATLPSAAKPLGCSRRRATFKIAEGRSIPQNAIDQWHCLASSDES